MLAGKICKDVQTLINSTDRGEFKWIFNFHKKEVYLFDQRLKYDITIQNNQNNFIIFYYGKENGKEYSFSVNDNYYDDYKLLKKLYEFAQSSEIIFEELPDIF